MSRTYQDIRKEVILAVGRGGATGVRLDRTDSQIVRQRRKADNRVLAEGGNLAPQGDKPVTFLGYPLILDAERTEVVFSKP